MSPAIYSCNYATGICSERFVANFRGRPTSWGSHGCTWNPAARPATAATVRSRSATTITRNRPSRFRQRHTGATNPANTGHGSSAVSATDTWDFIVSQPAFFADSHEPEVLLRERLLCFVDALATSG
ncbi:MAG: hypothetical protein KDJ33_01685 [Gammaproteobacteria bacterium]|nr:hypothetical protein [Gammaproteobacteria bacterium]